MEQQLYTQIITLREQYPDLVVIIYGPTATGKSWLSLRLADLFLESTLLSPWGNKGSNIIKNNWVINWRLSWPRVKEDSFPQKNSFHSALCSEWQIEIISADSRQVYRYMDIGTDKVSSEDRNRIPHHLIDIIDPDEEYTAHQRQQDTKKLIADIIARGNIPVIVWGTGLYIDTIYKNFNLPPNIKANRKRREEIEAFDKINPGYARDLLNQVDPDTAAEFHPANIRYIIRAIEIYEQTGIPKSVLAQEHPVDHPILMISLTRDTETANTLIHKRVEEMIERWLIEEVQSLLKQWYSTDLQSMNGIGYRQTVDWLLRHPALLHEVAKRSALTCVAKETESKDLPQQTGSVVTRDDANLIDLINSIALASVQYAHRQRTRFRRYKKDSLNNLKENVFYMEIEMW
jgi:tRNA dimethylallyltransferase